MARMDAVTGHTYELHRFQYQDGRDGIFVSIIILIILNHGTTFEHKARQIELFYHELCCCNRVWSISIATLGPWDTLRGVFDVVTCFDAVSWMGCHLGGNHREQSTGLVDSNKYLRNALTVNRYIVHLFFSILFLNWFLADCLIDGLIPHHDWKFNSWISPTLKPTRFQVNKLDRWVAIIPNGTGTLGGFLPSLVWKDCELVNLCWVVMVY